jgi:succinoglycan biosynthesis transport protein ExoP
VNPAQVEALGSTRRGNRRRLLVFTIAFVLCLLAGMAWNLARPSVYQASARIQLKVPTTTVRNDASGTTTPASDFLSLAQSIDSVATLKDVAGKLPPGSLPQGVGGAADEVAILRGMVEVHPVPGTDILLLSATGGDPQVLAPIVEHLIAAFGEQLRARYEAENVSGLASLRDELARLEKTAAERRAQLEAFRNRAGIISTERDDSASLARHKGLATALNTAIEKQATAEARLGTLQQAAASAPDGGDRLRDDPALTAQEVRLSALREELRELERAYTPAFLAMDPRAIGLRARLAEMQRQIAQKRTSGQQSALAAAAEDVEVARANVERLRVRLQGEQAGLRTFSTGFARSKHLEEDVAQVERARRETIERLARLEASQRSRAPRMTVLEAPRPPTQPHAPDRWRDGLLVSAAAFAVGLVAMGFVELFNRAPPAVASPMATLVLPSPALYSGRNPPLTVRAGDVPAQLGTASEQPRLSHAPEVRELSQAEAAALIAASSGTARLACVLALVGLDTEEATGARVCDIDPAAGILKVQGAAARHVRLPAWLVAGTERDKGEAWLLPGAGGAAWQSGDMDVAIACAAVDAGIDSPSSVSGAVLRNTCIGWLVAQGMRFAELAHVVGRIGPGTVATFGERAQRSARRPIDEIDTLMPAVRLPPPDSPAAQAA